MNRSVFVTILKILYLVRTLLVLVLNLVFTLPFLRPKIWPIRREFELKNQNELLAQSFHEIGEKAQFCVSVSSEGELEQALYFIIHYLKIGRKVEIIYTSPSVEHKIKILGERFSENLRAMRLPLLTEVGFTDGLRPKWHEWVSAEHFIFCRYDFYPELLLIREQVKTMELFSAALLNKKTTGLSGLYLKNVFGLFDHIYLASPSEEIKFKALGIKCPMDNLEWRVLAINERLEFRNYQLENRLSPFVENIGALQGDNFIFGSVWPNEWSIIKEVIKYRGSARTYIFPHDTSDATIAFFKQKCIELQRPFIVVGEQNKTKIADEVFNVPGVVVIFKVKGILLESFPLADTCYIGGGFGRSIHSVLEPFLALSKVIVGPKTHRSTEFELFKSVDPDTIAVIEEQSADVIHSTLRKLENLLVNREKRNKFKEQVRIKAEELLARS